MTTHGSFEAVDHYSGVGWFAKGWAFDPERPNEAIELVLYGDGKPLEHFRADQYRSDLASAGLGSGQCSFELQLPKELIDGRPHRLEIIVPHERRVLPNNTTDLFFPTYQRGQIERFEHATLEGWAVNTLTPDRPAILDLLIDGKWVDIIRCELPRPDLRDFQIYTDEAGFRCSLPEQVFDDQPHEVELVFSNTKFHLENSPKSLRYGPWLLTSRWKRIAEDVKDAQRTLAKHEIALTRQPLNKLADRASYHRWLEHHERQITQNDSNFEGNSQIHFLNIDVFKNSSDLQQIIMKSDAQVFCLIDDTIHIHSAFTKFLVEAFTAAQITIAYTDFDYIDENGSRHTPNFLPDWDPDRHLEKPYVAFEIVIDKATLIFAMDRLRSAPKFNNLRRWRQGIIDETLLMTCGSSIKHLPYVLLHKTTKTEAWINDDTRKNQVQKHLETEYPGVKTKLLTNNQVRVLWPLPDPAPKVTIIIPTRDRIDLLEALMEGLIKGTDYSHFDIIIIDNASTTNWSKKYFDKISELPFVTIKHWPGAFNYAAMHNATINELNAPYVCFLNNDIKVIHSDWLAEMMSLAVRTDVAAVGAKLLYPDDMIQHGGVVVGQHGVADNAQQAFSANDSGYLDSAQVVQNVSAVTAACMVARRMEILAVGNMDEENLAISFNDVDLCLKLRAHGKRIIWSPHAQLYHHESATRSQDQSPIAQAREKKEALHLRNKYGTNKNIDPFYNTNLSQMSQTHLNFYCGDVLP